MPSLAAVGTVGPVEALEDDREEEVSGGLKARTSLQISSIRQAKNWSKVTGFKAEEDALLAGLSHCPSFSVGCVVP